MDEESDVRREGEQTGKHEVVWVGAAAAARSGTGLPCNRATAPLRAGTHAGCSEVQARLARRICQRLHAAVVPEAATVKAHLPKRGQQLQSGMLGRVARILWHLRTQTCSSGRNRLPFGRARARSQLAVCRLQGPPAIHSHAACCTMLLTLTQLHDPPH